MWSCPTRSRGPGGGGRPLARQQLEGRAEGIPAGAEVREVGGSSSEAAARALGAPRVSRWGRRDGHGPGPKASLPPRASGWGSRGCSFLSTAPSGISRPFPASRSFYEGLSSLTSPGSVARHPCGPREAVGVGAAQQAQLCAGCSAAPRPRALPCSPRPPCFQSITPCPCPPSPPPELCLERHVPSCCAPPWVWGLSITRPWSLEGEDGAQRAR